MEQSPSLHAEFSPIRGRRADAGLGWMDPAAVGLPAPVAAYSDDDQPQQRPAQFL
jgi:hypothetical protein